LGVLASSLLSRRRHRQVKPVISRLRARSYCALGRHGVALLAHSGQPVADDDHACGGEQHESRPRRGGDGCESIRVARIAGDLAHGRASLAGRGSFPRRDASAGLAA